MRFFQIAAGILQDSMLLFWIMILVSGVLILLNRKRISLVIAAISISWLFIISVSPLPQFLVRQLEDDYPVFGVWQIDDSDSVHILILGGGHSITPALPSTGQLTPNALSRLAEGVRICRLLPRSTIITSGYSSSGRITQAQMLKSAALELGLREEAIKMSMEPANTKQEVNEYAKRFWNKRHKLIVVTSAWHMRRAIRYFQNLGISAIAAPADFMIKPDALRNELDLLPSATKIQMMNIVLHEHLGMLEIHLSKLTES